MPIKPTHSVNSATTMTRSQPAYDAATIKNAGTTAAVEKNVLDKFREIVECFKFFVCMTLTNASKPFTSASNVKIFPNNQPIAQESTGHGNDPHQ